MLMIIIFYNIFLQIYLFYYSELHENINAVEPSFI